jgi:hypothetical protein
VASPDSCAEAELQGEAAADPVALLLHPEDSEACREAEGCRLSEGEAEAEPSAELAEGTGLLEARAVQEEAGLLLPLELLQLETLLLGEAELLEDWLWETEEEEEEEALPLLAPEEELLPL